MGNCISINEVYPDTLAESINTIKTNKNQIEPYTSLRRRRPAIYFTESEARIAICSI
jgi:hypothetical protein